MRKMVLLPIVLLCVAAAPATKPAKPPTYAELKAENEKLRAEVEQLRRELADMKARIAPAADDGAIKVGMTLAEAERIAREKATLVADDGTTQTYRSTVADPSDPKAYRIYTMDVRKGKIVSLSVSNETLR